MKFNKSNIRLAILLIIIIAFICYLISNTPSEINTQLLESYANDGIDNEAFEKQMALQKKEKAEGYYQTNLGTKDFMDVIW